MKLTILGASGFIGTKVVDLLAADGDVAAEVARVAGAQPINGIVNIVGPHKISFAEMARTVLARRGESTNVAIDADATFFGTEVDDDSLVTGADGVGPHGLGVVLQQIERPC